MTYLFRAILSLTLALAFASTFSCKSETTNSKAIRLTTVYKPEFVQNRSALKNASIRRAEWKFENSAGISYETLNIADAKIDGKNLSGRTTSVMPIVRIERKEGLKDIDTLHSMEIRMKASKGANIFVAFEEGEKVNLKELAQLIKHRPFGLKTPLLAGDTIRTYTMTPPRPRVASTIRQILIVPTDASDATFSIESVRLIFRKEYLAGIPSGVSWQGLSEIYKETLVARSPEKIRLPIRVPQSAWLDLSLGTLDNSPVEFSVVVKDGNKQEDLLLRRTVTTEMRWETAQVDLSRYAGQDVTLTLTASGRPQTLALWGAPVIRINEPPSAKSSVEGVPAPQGVILIWGDTIRSDHLDVYGYKRETAPNLKRMAKEGALFRHHMVQGTWTKVSTPSLLTSLYPTSHGITDFADRLPASGETLAEIFQNAGYATLNLSSILFTGQFTNLHQGFDEVHEDSSLPDQQSSKTARVYVDRLLPWLQMHKHDPFFVLLHVSDPHDPYRPYAPYDGMWADLTKAEEHEKNEKEARKFIEDPLLKNFGMPSRAELIKAKIDPDQYVQMNRDYYDGSIRAMDAEIGRLLERLRELNLDDKTLVIFAGDHGEEFFDHGRSFHGQSVYGELADTPLIMRMPGTIPPGTVVEETVESIDLMPTILQLCGLSTAGKLQGRSLWPVLRTPARSSGTAEAKMNDGRPAFVEKAFIKDAGGPPPRDTEATAIVMGQWKLVHNTKRAAGAAEFELYDRMRDPNEKTNIASKHPEIVRRLTDQLGRWRKLAESQKLKSDADATRGMSQEELERLRSLGYIQ